MENVFETLLTAFRSELRQVKAELLNELKSVKIDRNPKGLENYISAEQASEMLGVQKKTLIDHKTKIGFVKQFKQIWFLKDDLQAYMEQGRPERRRIMRTRPNAIKRSE